MLNSIELTQPEDRMFAQIAQGAVVNNSTLPSGLLTPPYDMIFVGNFLVPQVPMGLVVPASCTVATVAKTELEVPEAVSPKEYLKLSDLKVQLMSLVDTVKALGLIVGVCVALVFTYLVAIDLMVTFANYLQENYIYGNVVLGFLGGLVLIGVMAVPLLGIYRASYKARLVRIRNSEVLLNKDK